MPEESSKCLNKYVPDYTVFDLETTGVSRENDQIVEISAVKVRGGEIVDTFSSLVNPGMKMPLDAMMVNHITDSMLENAPTVKQILPSFFRFTEMDILVGHNIHTFDIPFITRDCKRNFNKIPPHRYVDTLRFARAVLPGLSSYKLTSLADMFGIETDGAHRALNDCIMNQQVFEKLGEKAAAAESNIKTCPLCGSPMILRKGKFGEFYGCTAYPVCKHTEK